MFYFKNGLVQVPKVGKLKYKADYPNLDLEKVTSFRNVRISFVNGKWILSFSIEYENQVIKEEDKHGSLGIDLGVGRLAVVAFEGTKREYNNINKTKTVRNLKRKLVHIQRILSRKYEAAKKNGKGPKEKSNQILKYEALLKRIYHKIACIRSSTTIYKDPEMGVIRVLKEDPDGKDRAVYVGRNADRIARYMSACCDRDAHKYMFEHPGKYAMRSTAKDYCITIVRREIQDAFDVVYPARELGKGNIKQMA